MLSKLSQVKTAPKLFSRRFYNVQTLYKELVLEKLETLHPFWIRERCTDSYSVDPTTKQPNHVFSSVDVNLKVDKFQIENENVVVKFNDGHSSEFVIADLLYDVSEFEQGRKGIQTSSFQVPGPVAWTKSGIGFDANGLSWFDDSELKNNDAVLFEFCSSLLVDGVVLIDNVEKPGIWQSITRTADLVGPVRATSWGKVFNVKAIPDSGRKDLAFTGAGIPPHTDNPYRISPPSYQWLHCIENDCSGGANYFVDGFYCAELLRKQNPEYFDILTKVKARWENHDGVEGFGVSWSPILKVKSNGELEQIRWSDKSGGYAPPLPRETLDVFFRAKHELCRLLNARENQIHTRLQAGQMVVVDNARVLHARTSFDANEGVRHYHGCYTDRDGIVSKYLHLKYTNQFMDKMYYYKALELLDDEEVCISHA